MTLKEFDVQIALGLIPFTFISEPLQKDIDCDANLILNLGDKQYSSRDYHWMRKLSIFTALHYQIYKDIAYIRSTLIEEGILI